MRGYVVEGVLTAAGAAGALTVGLRDDSTFWSVTGVVLGIIAVACLLASVRMKLTGPADPEKPTVKPTRRLTAGDMTAVPPAGTVRRFSRRRKGGKPGASDLAA